MERERQKGNNRVREKGKEMKGQIEQDVATVSWAGAGERVSEDESDRRREGREFRE